ncbi:MAG: HAD family hydrolase [Planctomycetes bacterium]|nr:HAD family hydrolase [Planctomycetota bacterium]
MKFKAVIFDLDGTLLNTLDDLADSANVMLTQLGYPLQNIASFNAFVGDGSRMMISRALPESARDEDTITQALALFNNEYKKRYDVKTKPYRGINEMLFALQDKGLPLVVYSNKPHPATVACVEKLLPQEVFTLILGQREGIPVKPDPTAALEIAAQFKLQPQDCLYLGDTNTDMWTAVNAGMFPVGAEWGFRTREELWEAGAEEILQSPEEILKFF